MQKLLFILAVLVASVCHASSTDSLFTIQGEKGKLAVHLQLPDGEGKKKLPIVIICHGLGGNQNEPFISKIAADVLKDGMGVVRFDFNGHGQSEGDFQEMDALNIQSDLLSVIEWTKAQQFTKNISLVGHSLGGIVTGMVAGELGDKEIKSLVLIASGGVAPDLMLMGNFYGTRFDPWNMPDYIPFGQDRKLGKNYMTTMRDLPIYQTAHKYKGHTLVLNGTHDNVVPYNYAIRYSEVMPKAELRLIDGENHGFTKTADTTAEYIAEWLHKQTH